MSRNEQDEFYRMLEEFKGFELNAYDRVDDLPRRFNAFREIFQTIIILGEQKGLSYKIPYALKDIDKYETECFNCLKTMKSLIDGYINCMTTTQIYLMNLKDEQQLVRKEICITCYEIWIKHMIPDRFIEDPEPCKFKKALNIMKNFYTDPDNYKCVSWRGTGCMHAMVCSFVYFAETRGFGHKLPFTYNDLRGRWRGISKIIDKFQNKEEREHHFIQYYMKEVMLIYECLTDGNNPTMEKDLCILAYECFFDFARSDYYSIMKRLFENKNNI